MNVVVDVIHAVAVVADTLGAVTELQIGVVRIGAAADGALVEIAGLLLFGLGSPLEVHGSPAGAALLAADIVHEIAPEEDQIVQNADHDQYGIGPGALGEIAES